MVYAVAAKKASVQQCIENLENADLALQYIDIPELVQRNVASLIPEDQRGVALLYLDTTSGLITLTHQSILYLARGLEIGTRDLIPSKSSWVDEQPGGMTLEAGGMGQALLDNIVLEIQRSLDYYESHFAQPPINHLYIAPLAEEIPGLMSHLAANLGVQVQMLDLNNILDCQEPISQQEQSQNFLAIGAALRETA
jgi:MSHA biogenesis protein MshI